MSFFGLSPMALDKPVELKVCGNSCPVHMRVMAMASKGWPSATVGCCLRPPTVLLVSFRPADPDTRPAAAPAPAGTGTGPAAGSRCATAFGQPAAWRSWGHHLRLCCHTHDTDPPVPAHPDCTGEHRAASKLRGTGGQGSRGICVMLITCVFAELPVCSDLAVPKKLAGVTVYCN